MTARLPIDSIEVARRYQAGESTPRLAKRYRVSVIVIRQRLAEAGIPLRSRSAANVNRNARLTDCQRKAVGRQLTAGRRKKIVAKRTVRVSVMFEPALLARLDAHAASTGTPRQKLIREATKSILP